MQWVLVVAVPGRALAVFLIRDVPLENIVEVQVPITEDFIDWRCNTTHVAAECEDLLGTETS